MHSERERTIINLTTDCVKSSPDKKCLRSSCLADENVDTSAVLLSKAVRCFVPGKVLSVVAEFEVLLIETLAFRKYGKDDAESASVSQAEVRFFAGSLVSQKDRNGIVASGRLG